MRRLFLTIMAVLSMTMTFASNKKVTKSNGTAAYIASNGTEFINNENDYDMSYNIRRLGETLGLTLDQMSSIEALNRTFCNEMMTVANANANDRKTLLDNAVKKDFKYMSYILTPEQNAKYQTLINATLANRGLGK